MQRLLKGLATAAGLLPIVAWLALAGGIAAIVLTAVGRTVATFAAGGGEISLARRGNDRALQDFVVEVGRKLPNAEASDSMLGPTVPMPGIGRP